MAVPLKAFKSLFLSISVMRICRHRLASSLRFSTCFFIFLMLSLSSFSNPLPFNTAATPLSVLFLCLVAISQRAVWWLTKRTSEKELYDQLKRYQNAFEQNRCLPDKCFARVRLVYLDVCICMRQGVWYARKCFINDMPNFVHITCGLQELVLFNRKSYAHSYVNYHDKSTANARTIVAIRQETEPIFEDRGVVAHASEDVFGFSLFTFIRIAGTLYFRDHLAPGKIAEFYRHLQVFVWPRLLPEKFQSCE